MTDNVVALSTVTKPVLRVDPELVDLLRDLLKRAEDGEIQGAMIATIESDGVGNMISTASAYGGEGVRQNVHAAIGALEYLKARFIQQMLEW